MEADVGGEADPRWRGESLCVRLDFGGEEEAANRGIGGDNISSRSSPVLLEWSVGSCFRTKGRRGICITVKIGRPEFEWPERDALARCRNLD